MARRTRAFLDTHTLTAGIWSETGGAREVLRLGELRAIQVCVSGWVLQELDRALRRKSPTALSWLSVLLDRCQVRIVPNPDPHALARCATLVSHPGDAAVLAAAWSAEVEYFVTLDRKHFLDQVLLHETAPFPIGTPGDFLRWFRDGLVQQLMNHG